MRQDFSLAKYCTVFMKLHAKLHDRHRGNYFYTQRNNQCLKLNNSYTLFLHYYILLLFMLYLKLLSITFHPNTK